METTQSPVPPKQKSEEGLISMKFHSAILMMLDGKHVTRIAWNSNEEYGFMKDGYLSIHTKGRDFIWQLHETDIVAEDWIEVKVKN